MGYFLCLRLTLTGGLAPKVVEDLFDVYNYHHDG
jgi:hypothetical protein